MSGDLGQIGVQIDVLADELAGGPAGETVSLHAATAAYLQHRAWGRWLCWWLSHTVQRDHCKLVLSGQPAPPSAMALAGVQFAGIGVLLHWGAVAVWRLVF